MVFASKVFLVRPSRFGFNPQTAGNNAFQVRPDLSSEEIRRRALEEFDSFAGKLRSLGIETVVAEDPPEPFTPDAVFPNNWFSTHKDGTLVLYPMEAEARRLERMPSHIDMIRRASGTTRPIDLTPYEAEGRFLEGTGSLVIDHDSQTAFACISSRTDPGLAREWADLTGHELVLFRACGRDGTPVYHTNVLLCIGRGFAVLCREAVQKEEDLGLVTDALESAGKVIIPIGMDQMGEFAGNLLQLESDSGEAILVMSGRAREALTEAQINEIERHTRIAAFDVPIIEQCGGGSVRCMIAELFTS